ncbi:GL22636 [Drosophila persimilis]|uniref:GL22636 n=1 Tax=Drosophila persimilis TaxID=7234 RepID=B4H1N0_DROPE|nr:GL22636 [Drosophila persimilis]
MPVEHTNIKVAVRVRPYNAKELEHQQRSIIKVMDKSALLFDPDEEDDEFFFHGTKQNYRDITKRMNKKLTMEFDRVFDIDNTNQELFEECTAPLDYRRFNNYMTTLANQNDKYSEELPSWQDKVQHAYREVESLKREVNQSKLQQILGLYVKRKDLELQMAKQNISSNHLYLINRELVENSDLIRKSFTTACDVLCQAYNRLEDAEKLTPEIQALYDRLHRKMRFAESEANATEFEANETEKTGHKRLLASEEDEEQSTTTTASAKKRQFVRAAEIDDDLHLSVDSTDSLETDSDSDEAHKTFKKPHNLNQTQVLSTTYNALTSTVTKQRNVHQRIVTDLLSDQNVRGGNDKIKQVLLKSSNFTTQGLQRSLAAASIAKENVKFNGNYVRKSPRALVAKAMSGNPTITRKPLGTGNREPPLVKFNRAASFRLKK